MRRLLIRSKEKEFEINAPVPFSFFFAEIAAAKKNSQLRKRSIHHLGTKRERGPIRVFF